MTLATDGRLPVVRFVDLRGGLGVSDPSPSAGLVVGAAVGSGPVPTACWAGLTVGTVTVVMWYRARRRPVRGRAWTTLVIALALLAVGDVAWGASAAARRVSPPARKAVTRSRNRAIDVANGLRSTPPIASSARRASSRRFVAGSVSHHRSNRRAKMPSRKWPLPQVGSMAVVSRSPNVASAGSRVRSRMNSSTKTGVCKSAYVFLASSERSW